MHQALRRVEWRENLLATPAAERFPLFGKRSWFEGYDYIFLEPGERSRFSFAASLPAEATMVALHCEFIDKDEHVEIVKKCYAVPTAPS